MIDLQKKAVVEIRLLVDSFTIIKGKGEGPLIQGDSEAERKREGEVTSRSAECKHTIM